MKLPVLKAFSASAAYFSMRIGDVVRINWLPVLLLHGAMMILMPRYMEPVMQFQAMDPNADPAEALSAMGPAFQWMALLYLVMAIIYPMLIAGNLRPIIRGETTSLPFHLQFGMDELRVLATYILWVMLFSVVCVAGIIAVVAVSATLSLLSPLVGGVFTAVGALALMGAVVWFLMRMSLIFPATIAERKIGLPDSWRLTKGNSLPLFVFWLLWVLVFLALGLLYLVIVLPGYFGVIGEMIAAGQDQVAQQAAAMKMNQMQLDMWDISKPGAWFNFILSYVYTIITISLWNIAAGTAYRYITEGGADA